MGWDGMGERIYLKGNSCGDSFVLIVRWSVNRTSRWMRREFLWLEKDIYVGRYILSCSLLWVPHTYLMLSLSLSEMGT